MLDQLTSTVDGGCRGQGTPTADCYGSALITGRSEDHLHRWVLPEAYTSNQAEYAALLRALACAKRVLAEKYLAPADVTLTVTTDSDLMIRQLIGQYACSDTVLRGFRDNALSLLGEYADFVFEHITGVEMKATLGH